MDCIGFFFHYNIYKKSFFIINNKFNVEHTFFTAKFVVVSEKDFDVDAIKILYTVI